MWIQRFQIFKKAWPSEAIMPSLYIVADPQYYDNQRQAFQWIDEHADKESEYVILPVITFDNDATI